ncbi:metallophosphoesterase family protein [Sphingorhabdus arenilitoris]|uniref:Metallophosphoesterase family protein n=1 Tax=Sphingorhabdus arenilitoris TaxID=1490041 RepID=A0ABV8RHC0_9SPHN
MFKTLFKQKSKPRPIDAAQIPVGRRVYAIGDVHGRNDLLKELLRKILDDDNARGPADMQIIMLGDLVDRGPDSAGVIDTAMALKDWKPNTRFLTGNHEEVFLDAVNSGDPKIVRFFIRIGGESTILSYPISRKDYLKMDMKELAEKLPQIIPQRHVDFLTSFEDQIVIGDYIFVHAGIRPGVAIEDQEATDLRWIRGSFLNHKGDFEKVVVYGHTITKDVDESRSRIGIDTGAYDSGKLTAIGLEGGERWYLQTGEAKKGGKKSAKKETA